MQCAQVLAEGGQVGLVGFQLGQPRRLQQLAYFLVEVVAELAQLLLALAAFGFQALPFGALRQAVAAVEEFRRTTEEAAVGEDLFQCAAGFVQARVTGGATGQVAALELVLGQQQLSAQGGLLQ
ncbi:hypothetical protein D9M68_656910 [compost metagenome]